MSNICVHTCYGFNFDLAFTNFNVSIIMSEVVSSCFTRDTSTFSTIGTMPNLYNFGMEIFSG